jgi:hypothetical protein
MIAGISPGSRTAMPWGMTGCPAIPLSSTGSSPWLALEVTPERDRLAERNFGMATLVNMSLP